MEYYSEEWFSEEGNKREEFFKSLGYKRIDNEVDWNYYRLEYFTSSEYSKEIEVYVRLKKEDRNSLDLNVVLIKGFPWTAHIYLNETVPKHEYRYSLEICGVGFTLEMPCNFLISEIDKLSAIKELL